MAKTLKNDAVVPKSKKSVSGNLRDVLMHAEVPITLKPTQTKKQRTTKQHKTNAFWQSLSPTGADLGQLRCSACVCSASQVRSSIVLASNRHDASSTLLRRDMQNPKEIEYITKANLTVDQTKIPQEGNRPAWRDFDSQGA